MTTGKLVTKTAKSWSARVTKRPAKSVPVIILFKIRNQGCAFLDRIVYNVGKRTKILFALITCLCRNLIFCTDAITVRNANENVLLTSFDLP